MTEIEELEEDLVFHVALVSLFSSREGNTKDFTARTYLRDPAASCIPIERQHPNSLAV